MVALGCSCLFLVALGRLWLIVVVIGPSWSLLVYWLLLVALGCSWISAEVHKQVWKRKMVYTGKEVFDKFDPIECADWDDFVCFSVLKCAFLQHGVCGHSTAQWWLQFHKLGWPPLLKDAAAVWCGRSCCIVRCVEQHVVVTCCWCDLRPLAVVLIWRLFLTEGVWLKIVGRKKQWWMKNMKRCQVDQLKACNQMWLRQLWTDWSKTTCHFTKTAESTWRRRWWVSCCLQWLCTNSVPLSVDWSLQAHWWEQTMVVPGGRSTSGPRTGQDWWVWLHSQCSKQEFFSGHYFHSPQEAGQNGRRWIGMEWKCWDIQAVMNVYIAQRDAFLMPSWGGILGILWLIRPPPDCRDASHRASGFCVTSIGSPWWLAGITSYTAPSIRCDMNHQEAAAYKIYLLIYKQNQVYMVCVLYSPIAGTSRAVPRQWNAHRCVASGTGPVPAVCPTVLALYKGVAAIGLANSGKRLTGMLAKRNTRAKFRVTEETQGQNPGLTHMSARSGKLWTSCGTLHRLTLQKVHLMKSWPMPMWMMRMRWCSAWRWI